MAERDGLDSCASETRNVASEEAADWFARLANDDVSDAECAEYRVWREADPANAAAFDKIAQTWNSLGHFADDPKIMEMRISALAEQADRDDVPASKFRMGALAASIALVAVLTALLVSGVGSFSDDAEALGDRVAVAPEVDESGALPKAVPASSIEAQSETLRFSSGYSTRLGQMAQFTLPDGSVIELNTSSEVRVNFSEAQRNLTLVRGEAVFTVAKDADRPFIVAAGENKVVALGTIFAVRKSETNTQVTLIEGRIRIDRDDSSGSGSSAQLVAGEQISILANRPFEIRRAELSEVASWRDGRLIFEQTPLRDVLKEFNRYSIEQHVLKDESLGDLLVSGRFRIKSGEHFAATLEAGFPVIVRARSDGSVLEVTATEETTSIGSVSGN